MWPFSIVFLLALNTPQQKTPAPGQDFRASKLPEFNFSQSAPQQNSPARGEDFRTGKLPEFRSSQSALQQKYRALSQELRARKLFQMTVDQMKSDTCFTMRSYVFHREDGQAPKLVSTTTCTPASTLRTLQTSPAPPVRLVPAK